jgi:hypothetical protein
MHEILVLFLCHMLRTRCVSYHNLCCIDEVIPKFIVKVDVMFIYRHDIFEKFLKTVKDLKVIFPILSHFEVSWFLDLWSTRNYEFKAPLQWCYSYGRATSTI